jgi:HNH endonuclease
MRGRRPFYKTLPRLPLQILPDEGIVKIPLPHNLYAIVDVEEWPKLEDITWSYSPSSGYAHAWIKATKERKLIHYMIFPKRDGFDIDHIDGDKLNNRKSNLRYATRSQNKANVSKNSRTKEHVGVHWDKSRQR